MALVKDFPIGSTTLTVAGAYHRVVGFSATLVPSPMLTVTVATYANQAARTANAGILSTSTITIQGAAAVTFFGMAFWKTLVSRLYTQVVLADPTWAGAADATDPAE